MSTTTVPHGLIKHAGSDNWRTALKTDDPANMEYINAALSRNLLVNPGFENNQRGGTVTANNAYAHDRWQILVGGTSTISVTDETTTVDTGSGHALKAVYTQGSANSSIEQKIEDYLQLRGRTVTFTIRVRTGVAPAVQPYVDDSGSRTYGSVNATTGAYATLTVTAAIGASATSVKVGASLSASTTSYLDNATLHVGSAAVIYTPQTPAEDLARCLRYYEVQGGVTAALAIYGYVPSATVFGTAVSFNARKGGTPTVTKNGTWATTNCGQPSIQGANVAGYALFATGSGAGMCVFYPDSADDTIVAEWNA